MKRPLVVKGELLIYPKGQFVRVASIVHQAEGCITVRAVQVVRTDGVLRKDVCIYSHGNLYHFPNLSVFFQVDTNSR